MDPGTRPIPLHQEPAKVRPTSPPPENTPRRDPDSVFDLVHSRRPGAPPAFRLPTRPTRLLFIPQGRRQRVRHRRNMQPILPVRSPRSPSVPSPSIASQRVPPPRLARRFRRRTDCYHPPLVPPQTEINMPSYENGSSMQIKADNWSQLTKFFARCMPRFAWTTTPSKGWRGESPASRVTFSRRSHLAHAQTARAAGTAHARRFSADRWSVGFGVVCR